MIINHAKRKREVREFVKQQNPAIEIVRQTQKQIKISNEKIKELEYLKKCKDNAQKSKFKPGDVLAALYWNCKYHRPVVVNAVTDFEAGFNGSKVDYEVLHEDGRCARLTVFEDVDGVVKDLFSDAEVYTIEEFNDHLDSLHSQEQSFMTSI